MGLGAREARSRGGGGCLVIKGNDYISSGDPLLNRINLSFFSVYETKKESFTRNTMFSLHFIPDLILHLTLTTFSFYFITNLVFYTSSYDRLLL